MARGEARGRKPIIGRHWSTWFFDPELRNAVFSEWKEHLNETRKLTSQRDLYDKLIEQIKIAAGQDKQVARNIALLHCRMFLGYAPESVREKYYQAAHELVSVSATELNEQIDAAAAAEIAETGQSQ